MKKLYHRGHLLVVLFFAISCADSSSILEKENDKGIVDGEFLVIASSSITADQLLGDLDKLGVQDAKIESLNSSNSTQGCFEILEDGYQVSSKSAFKLKTALQKLAYIESIEEHSIYEIESKEALGREITILFADGKLNEVWEKRADYEVEVSSRGFITSKSRSVLLLILEAGYLSGQRKAVSTYLEKLNTNSIYLNNDILETYLRSLSVSKTANQILAVIDQLITKVDRQEGRILQRWRKVFDPVTRQQTRKTIDRLILNKSYRLAVQQMRNHIYPENEIAELILAGLDDKELTGKEKIFLVNNSHALMTYEVEAGKLSKIVDDLLFINPEEYDGQHADLLWKSYQLSPESSNSQKYLNLLTQYHKGTKAERRAKRLNPSVVNQNQKAKATLKPDPNLLKDPMDQYLWGLDAKVEVDRVKRESYKGDYTYYTYEVGEKKGSNSFGIDLKRANSIQKEKTDIIVAVVDSGVDYNHPDLQNMMALNTGEFGEWTEAPEGSLCKRLECNRIDDDGNGYVDDLYGFDFANEDSNPMDDNAHGTHVAGTIAAEAGNQIGLSGISQKAKILAVKVMDRKGRGGMKDILNGIAYSVSRGARIINLSLGGVYYSPLAEKMYECAYKKNTLIIASSGNSNNREKHYPSDYDYALSVAAHNTRGKRTYFSNHSTGVDISAPGLKILSTYPTKIRSGRDLLYLGKENKEAYASFNGTSMSSPHISGVAAYLLSSLEIANVDELFSRILLGGKKLDESKEINRLMGKGAVNLANSLGVEPQAFIYPLGGSQLLEYDYSSSLESSKSFDKSIKLRNFWSDAANVKISVTLEDERIVLNREDYMFSDWKNKEERILKISGKIVGEFESVTDLPIRILVQHEKGFHAEDITLRINPYYHMFDISDIKQSLIGHKLWVPSFGSFGTINEVDSEGRSWFGSSVDTKTAMSRWRTESRAHYLTQLDQNGKNISPWPLIVRTASYDFKRIFGPFKSMNKNDEFIIQFKKGDIWNFGGEQLEKDFEGVISLSGNGEVTASLDMKLARESNITRTSSDDTYLVTLTDDTYQKGEYHDTKLFTLHKLDGDLKLANSITFLANQVRGIEISVCDLDGDKKDEILVNHHINLLKNSGYGHRQESNILDVYNSELEKIGSLSFGEGRLESLKCEFFGDQKKKSLLMISNSESEPYYLREMIFDSNKRFKAKWSQKLDFVSGTGQINVLAGLDGGKKILINQEGFEGAKMLLVNSHGKLEKGWPKPTLDSAKQPYFIHYALVVELQGRKYILINEASNHMHLMDLEGNLIRHIRVPGNILARPRIIKEADKTIVILTTHRGVQKISL